MPSCSLVDSWPSLGLHLSLCSILCFRDPTPFRCFSSHWPRCSCQPSFVLTTTLQTPLNMTLPRKSGAAPRWKSQPQHRSQTAPSQELRPLQTGRHLCVLYVLWHIVSTSYMLYHEWMAEWAKWVNKWEKNQWMSILLAGTAKYITMFPCWHRNLLETSKMDKALLHELRSNPYWFSISYISTRSWHLLTSTLGWFWHSLSF